MRLLNCSNFCHFQKFVFSLCGLIDFSFCVFDDYADYCLHKILRKAKNLKTLVIYKVDYYNSEDSYYNYNKLYPKKTTLEIISNYKMEHNIKVAKGNDFFI